MGCLPHMQFWSGGVREVESMGNSQPFSRRLPRDGHDVFPSPLACLQAAGGSAPCGGALLPANRSQVAVAHQLLTLFIPEAEGE